MTIKVCFISIAYMFFFNLILTLWSVSTNRLLLSFVANTTTKNISFHQIIFISDTGSYFDKNKNKITKVSW